MPSQHFENLMLLPHYGHVSAPPPVQHVLPVLAEVSRPVIAPLCTEPTQASGTLHLLFTLLLQKTS